MKMEVVLGPRVHVLVSLQNLKGFQFSGIYSYHCMWQFSAMILNFTKRILN